LSGALSVSFNGAAASITSDSAAKIVTSVPSGTTSGYITVTTPVGIAVSPMSSSVT
jgi:hypothetical protein